MSLERKIANLAAATTALDEDLKAGYGRAASSPAVAFANADAAIAAAAAATAVSLTAMGTSRGRAIAGELRAVDSIADLLRIPREELFDGMQVSVRRYRSGSVSGGGILYWNAASERAENRGTLFAIPGVASGRWIRLYDVLEPQHFGASGLGTADDTMALQAFADYLGDAATSDVAARMFGKFRTSAKLRFSGEKRERPLTLYCGFSIHPTHSSDDEAMLFTGLREFTQVGAMAVVGAGGTKWVGRSIGKGFVIEDCGGSTFDFILTEHAKWDAVTIRGDSSMVTIKHVHSRYCGSNGLTSVIGFRFKFSGRTDRGNSGHPGQRSVLRVSAADAARVRARQAYVAYAGEPYFVEAVDRASNTISVSPWLPLAAGNTAGELAVLDGAGLYLHGSDVSQCAIGMVDAIGCGTGLFSSALYPPVVQSLVTQSCGIGYAFSTVGNAALGGQLLTSYYEGNSYDIVKGSASYNAQNVVGNTTNLNWAKVVGLGSRYHGDALPVRTSLGRMAIWSANHGQYLSVASNPFVGETIHCPGWRGDLTKSLHIDQHLTRCFGYTVRDFTVFGDGPNAEPLVVIILTVPSGYAINEGALGASAAFSGFTGPVRFLCRLNENFASRRAPRWSVTLIRL